MKEIVLNLDGLYEGHYEDEDVPDLNNYMESN